MKPPSLRAPRTGFTLVEVIVALVIFAVGLMGLMGTSMLATRMIVHSQQTSIGVAFAKRTLDSLRVAGCAAPLNGSATLKRGTTTVDSLSWTFTAQASGTGIGPASQSVRLILKSLVAPNHWRAGLYETELSCLV
ncbi:MAG TPA: prepilin-type N-terminal cleavage/methylation domain-containing protein [Gemmatimonadales bacterium]